MECSICNIQFSRRSNLLKHARSFHGLQRGNIIGMFTCLEEDNCQSFRYCYQLISHLESYHGLEVTREQLKFDNFSEFQNWMKNLELTENVRFSRNTGKTYNDSTHTRKTYYHCSRSGKQRLISDDKRKYTLRTQGSCKMNFGCTSQIMVKEDTISKSCEVVYISSHYGHTEEGQHLRLSKICLRETTNKLIMGVSERRILDTDQDDIEVRKIMRDDLLTRKDISNIKTDPKLPINDDCRHTDDATSGGGQNNKIRIIQNTRIRNPHRVAATKPCVVILESEDSFKVKDPESQHEYIVQKKKDEACCALECSYRAVCVHSFFCPCPDFSIRHTICKHIHSVVLTGNVEVEQMISDRDENLNGMEILNNLVKEPLHSEKICTEDWKEGMKAETKTINECVDIMDLSEEKQSLYLKSLKNFATQLKLELQTSVRPNERTFTNIDHFANNNSEIEKQKSFFSTKKKSNKKKAMKKPSSSDEKIITETLSGSLFLSDSTEHDHTYT